MTVDNIMDVLNTHKYENMKIDDYVVFVQMKPDDNWQILYYGNTATSYQEARENAKRHKGYKRVVVRVEDVWDFQAVPPEELIDLTAVSEARTHND